MEEKKKSCFIITPMGDNDSEIRKEADGVIAVVSQVLEELGYNVTAPHHISEPGSITRQVIERIVNDDLVVANLTGLNPNVMYELAVRHAFKKPVICIAEEATETPFDMKDDRVIFFQRDISGWVSFQQELKKMVEQASENKDVIDNPIYRALAISKIEHNTTLEEDVKNMLLIISERLEDSPYITLNLFSHLLAQSIREQKLKEAKPEDIVSAFEKIEEFAQKIKSRNS